MNGPQRWSEIARATARAVEAVVERAAAGTGPLRASAGDPAWRWNAPNVWLSRAERPRDATAESSIDDTTRT